jgi:hypothetical protein
MHYAFQALGLELRKVEENLETASTSPVFVESPFM